MFLPGLAAALAQGGSSLRGQGLIAGSLGLKADTGPERSESGIGALMPWADALWAVNYNSHKKGTGSGLGLHRIDENLKAERVHVHDGTHANRLIHRESNQCVIGPYAIDLGGKVRVIDSLLDHRITATFRHLTDPAGRLCMLTMEGLLFDLDVQTLRTTLVVDLVKQFNINKRPHFKGGYSSQGRIVVANNGFYEFGESEAGLFEFDGSTWRALSRKPHMDVTARQDMGQVLFATGWDESSVLFWALVKGVWQKYRLPKASHAFSHAWQTEWMRIREVETEHYLMDIQAMFYELQPVPFEGAIWGVKPICQHLRMIPDFCSFRGALALAGNQTTPNRDNNAVVGQPQAGIWFGKTDDLWSWGKPQGWGRPWRRQAVRAGEWSEPFLMTGFDHKVLHLRSDRPCQIQVQVDFLGNGEWNPYERLSVGEYKYHIFPAGFSAHWVRLSSDTAATVSAEFIYT
jgi:hypothetical protein